MACLLRCFLPLLGMGLRRLSMSPTFVPPLKNLAHLSTSARAPDVAGRVLRMKSATEARRYLTAAVREVWPEAELLDAGG